MDNTKIYVGLDLGTTVIRAIIGEAVNDQLNIIGIGSERSQGIRAGSIVDIDKVVSAVQSALKQAQEKANVEIHEVIVGLPPLELSIESAKGMVMIGNQPQDITDTDVEQIGAATLMRKMPPDREVVSLTPLQFSVDGQSGITDPRGMQGMRLELEALLYSVPKMLVVNIRKVLQRLNLNLRHFVLSPLGLSSVALNDGEQDFGTVVVDMGATLTTAFVIHDHKLKYVTIDPEGGFNLTKDVSVVLNTSVDSAEKIKRDFGVALAADTSEGQHFPVEVVGQDQPISVSETYLAEILEARFTQIFERLQQRLEPRRALELPGGIVLTGGVAETVGIAKLATQVLHKKTRVFEPQNMGLRNAALANGVGLVKYAFELSEVELLLLQSLSEKSDTTTESVKQLHQQHHVLATPMHEQLERTETPQEGNPLKKGQSALKSFWNKFFD